ncbi:MAG: alpha/beta hydrolase [Bermanella sp.]
MKESVSNQAKTLYVKKGEVSYAYRKFGKQSELPLVLFQRFRGTMDHWDPDFLDKLAQTRTVIIFDNSGVARSSGNTPSSVESMAQAASDFIQLLDYPKVDVLGWSLGGFIAQQIALDRPKTINKLIVAGSGPGGVADAPAIPEKVLAVMQKPNSENPMEDFLYLFFTESQASRTAGMQHLGRLGKRDESFGPEANAEAMTAQGAAVMSWAMGKDSAYERLESLSQPILVANGQHDIMIHAYNSFAMAQRAPNAKLVLYPDSGHGFLFQYADEFAKEVNEFLN